MNQTPTAEKVKVTIHEKDFEVEVFEKDRENYSPKAT